MHEARLAGTLMPSCANRAVCEDFEGFKPLFEQVQRELKSGVRKTLPVHNMEEIRLAEIQKGEYVIVGGQIAYVAETGEDFTTQYDRRDSRLRVIYDNGTESYLLTTIWQVAQSMFSAPNLSIRLSRPTAMFYIRSASRGGRLRRV